LTKDLFGGVTKYPQSLNMYAYAQGDPVDNTDPNGNILPILAVAIAYGAADASVYTYNNWGNLKNVLKTILEHWKILWHICLCMC